MMLASHQDAGKVALWLGNSPKILLSHYHHLSDAADADAFWRILPRQMQPELDFDATELQQPAAKRFRLTGNSDGGQSLAAPHNPLFEHRHTTEPQITSRHNVRTRMSNAGPATAIPKPDNFRQTFPVAGPIS